ncbi:MAG: DUF4276 family protein [Planctomycetaceae bacterium]|jgi:hypothetical protein|nr:DUF4276 family protein [Planctomycetaceae bacterium]
MYRVYAVVEGQTERAVFQEVLAPYLADRGIIFCPRVVGKPGHKGGDCKFSRVLPDICNLLRQENNTFVTTFFDYYALPDDWANRNVSESESSYNKKAELIEEGMKKTVLNSLEGLNPARFVPYVQMYELEALFFSDTIIMGKVLGTDDSVFQDILNEFAGNCEEINDSRITAPSKRIIKIVSSYKKGSSVDAHGWRIIKQIGIEKIRKRCYRFDAWLSQLEQLK